MQLQFCKTRPAIANRLWSDNRVEIPPSLGQSKNVLYWSNLYKNNVNLQIRTKIMISNWRVMSACNWISLKPRCFVFLFVYSFTIQFAMFCNWLLSVTNRKSSVAYTYKLYFNRFICTFRFKLFVWAFNIADVFIRVNFFRIQDYIYLWTGAKVQNTTNDFVT